MFHIKLKYQFLLLYKINPKSGIIFFFTFKILLQSKNNINGMDFNKLVEFGTKDLNHESSTLSNDNENKRSISN